MNSQVVEVLGRNQLTEELLRAGLEVSLPVRDRGIDLIAYADLAAVVKTFVARPIQMKAATGMSFGLDRKYANFPGLLIAYVWHIAEPDAAVTFALTYAEALDVARRMGYTKTESWRRGTYVNTRPGGRLRRLLEPYRMSPRKWWARVAEGR